MEDVLRFAIIIPAYNEEKHIRNVIQGCKKFTDNIIVIDDGSTDQTSDIADQEHVFVRKLFHNYGKGFALRNGFNLRLDPFSGNEPDFVITIDSDMQHDPNEIKRLISANDHDIVIGSRFLEKNKIPFYRRFGIEVINFIYNFGCKEKITDSQSGFRMYDTWKLDNILPSEHGFGYSTEMLIRARKLGYTITEVPITSIYHKNLHSNSTLNPIVHGLTVALKTIYWRIRIELLGMNNV